MKVDANFLGNYVEKIYGVTDFIFNEKRYVKTTAGIWIEL